MVFVSLIAYGCSAGWYSPLEDARSRESRFEEKQIKDEKKQGTKLCEILKGYIETF